MLEQFFKPLVGDLPLHPFVYGIRFTMGFISTDQVLSPTAKIRRKCVHTSQIRPMARSLGCHVKFMVPLYHDNSDVELVVKGAVHRWARAVPPFQPSDLRKFRGFVRKWLRKHFKPLTDDEILSFEEWLEETQYTVARKKELRELFDREERKPPRTKRDRKRCYRVKCFIKRESYEGKPKNARWIMSRSDWYKCLVGPVFKSIEKKVYDLGIGDGQPGDFIFIKHIPVRDRPSFMRTTLERYASDKTHFVETDHTAFEAHMVPEVMRAVEMQVYKYFLKNRPDLIELLDGVLDGANRLTSKYVDAQVQGRRMSGEMCTSLGNGLTNLLAFLFACQEDRTTVLAGFVEGDDGLFAMKGPSPRESTFAKLGFEVKSAEYSNWYNASFCGMNMVEDKGLSVIVRDPLKIIMKTGVSHSTLCMGSPYKLRQLLKAKAFSLAYENEGCPIAGAFGRYILRVTKGLKPLFNEGEVSWMVDAKTMMSQSELTAYKRCSTPVLEKARRVVASKYNLSAEKQVTIEKYLDSLSNLQALDHPVIRDYVLERNPEADEIGYMCLSKDRVRYI